MKKGLSISIVGAGNVGSHLAGWLETDHNVTLVSSRTLDNLPPESDVIIIATKDDVIPEVAEKVRGKAELIVHTSGSVPVSVLDGCAPKTGVFYPLQTFTKGVEMEKSEVPVFIEGSEEGAARTLSDIARTFTGHIYHAGSEERKKLHVAAVFACNFTNALIGMADGLLKEDGFDYTVLLPLIRQTIGKLSSIDPEKAQTGPAARGDRRVVESHIRMLESHPEYQEIYRAISQFIMKKKRITEYELDKL